MEEGAKKVSPSKNRRLQRPPADIDDFDEELIPGWMMDLEDWQSEDLIRPRIWAPDCYSPESASTKITRSQTQGKR